MNPLHTKFINEKDNKLKGWIVFASLSGNAEIVAGSICEGLNTSGIDTICSKAEISNPIDILKYDLIVLVSSTYDVGKLNNHMIKFNLDLSKLNLKEKRFQIVGLGDSEHYDIFCGAATILEETVLKAGGIQIQKPLKIDGSPLGRLNEYKEFGFKLGKTLKFK